MLKNKSIGVAVPNCLALIVLLLGACSTGQVSAGSSKDYLNADEQAIQAWREMKFGLFIHWGAYAQAAERFIEEQ